MFLVIVFFNSVNDSSRYDFQNRLYLRTTIGFVWFRFIYENKTVKDQLVPLICLVSPALTFLLSEKYCFRICIRQRTDYYKRANHFHRANFD
jgi:hypothetical protein